MTDRPCVFLVEDDPDDLLLQGRQLHELGLQVISAATVEQARLTVVSQMGARKGAPFDLALIDLRLVGSNGDGLGVVRYLRTVCPTLPVILVSGSISTVTLMALESMGHVSIAWKPLSQQTLVQILAAHKIPFTRPKPRTA